MPNKINFLNGFLSQLKIRIPNMSSDYYNLMTKFVELQANNESGNFTSNAWKLGNNAIGYGFFKGSPYQTLTGRKTSDDVKNLANFKSDVDCGKELADWLSRGDRKIVTKNLKTFASYVEHLKSNGYFTEPINDYFNTSISTNKNLLTKEQIGKISPIKK